MQGRSRFGDRYGWRSARVLWPAVVALALASAWAGLAPAAAGAQSRQTATLRFDSQLPGSSTAVAQSIRYFNPNDRAAKPFAVQRVVISLPEGSTVDTSVPARCGAPDPVLMAQGSAACPPASVVGSGKIDLDTGVPGPGRIVSNTVELINNTDELIFLLTEERTGDRLVTRGTIDGRRVITETPPIPGGPPDGFAALRNVDLQMRAVSTGGGAYVSTPASCPGSGSWASTGEFTYRDGVTQRTSSTTPCVSLPSSCPLASPNPIVGTGGGETLRGGSGEDLLIGRGGIDLLSAGGSDDCAYGDEGRDTVRGNGGDDRLEGGSGRDTLKGNNGDDRLDGGRGFDRLRAAQGNDVVRGGKGTDTLNSGVGADRLSGGAGDDRVRAGRGNDVLRGGGGDDILRTGGGRDRVNCGGGRDRVITITARRDRIAANCERVIRR